MCLIDGCEKRSVCRGWCSAHYHRWQRHGDPQGGTPSRVQNAGFTCRAPGCVKEAKKKGCCEAHYRVFKANGTFTLKRSPNGSGHLSDGYRIVRMNGKPTREHRAVIEAVLGRPLLASEHVHHVNGDKQDNRIENLRLTDASEHPRIHSDLKREYALTCPKGHPWAANEAFTNQGYRFCRQCSRDNALDYYYRVRRKRIIPVG